MGSTGSSERCCDHEIRRVVHSGEGEERLHCVRENWVFKEENRAIESSSSYGSSRVGSAGSWEQLLDLILSWVDHRGECADSLRLSSSRNAKELSESSSMKDAMQQDQMAMKICKNIQQLFDQLKGETGSVVVDVLQSLGKRAGFDEEELDFSSLITVQETSPRIDRTLTTNLLKILDFFTLKVGDEGLKCLHNVNMDNRKSTGGSAESTSLSTTGKWGPQLQDADGAKLSQSLRSISAKMMEAVEELRTAFKCISEAFAELKDVEECIADPECVCRRSKLLQYAQEHWRENVEEKSKVSEKTSLDGATFEPQEQEQTTSKKSRFSSTVHERMMKNVMRECQDEFVKSWLQWEGNSAFLGLVDLFQMMKTKLNQRKRKEKKKKESREIDIIFVAHGCITDKMIHSDLFRPLPSVLDVVLYQPWNCAINASVVYGIAAGTIEKHFCRFTCKPGCAPARYNQPHNHEPSMNPPTSNDWNRMKETQDWVPEIYLTPLNVPHDGAWKDFELLKSNNKYPNRDRVLIPFILPTFKGTHVPFSLVTLALSLVLKFSNLKARVHLAACLDRRPETQLDIEKLKRQYFVAPDESMMFSTQALKQSTEDERRLYEMFKNLFG